MPLTGDGLDEYAVDRLVRSRAPVDGWAVRRIRAREPVRPVVSRAPRELTARVRRDPTVRTRS
ncbi:hypothetical protein ACFXDH_48050 [Streptomyces sp. NPDC059467]|uniref:hypothetical protein n=1 Tax=Streptomyces sp. NPDC059467 TaxID=3346844 RepID=UPI0036B4115D